MPYFNKILVYNGKLMQDTRVSIEHGTTMPGTADVSLDESYPNHTIDRILRRLIDEKVKGINLQTLEVDLSLIKTTQVNLLTDYDRALLHCPLIGRLFEDPVVATDGYSYSRASLQQYLINSSTSPTTGEEISTKPDSLVSNKMLQCIVSDYTAQLDQCIAQGGNVEASHTQQSNADSGGKKYSYRNGSSSLYTNGGSSSHGRTDRGDGYCVRRNLCSPLKRASSIDGDRKDRNDDYCYKKSL